MVTYEECAAAIDVVFDAYYFLLVVVFLAGIGLGYFCSPRETIVDVKRD